MPKKKATSVPWRYFLFLSTSYAKPEAPFQPGVNNLSGAQTVFAQLLDERGAPHAQQTGRLGNRAVRFLQRPADESKFDRRQVILQVDSAARQDESVASLRHRERR